MLESAKQPNSGTKITNLIIVLKSKNN